MAEKGTKILISGASNTGKTTLLKSLKDALVFNYDNKTFPYAIPHRNVFEKEHGGRLSSGEDFKDRLQNLLKDYKTKTGKLPTVLAIDSVSTIAEDIETKLTESFKDGNGFKKWDEYRTSVHAINDAINSLINLGINVVMITHAVYNNNNGKWEDTTKGGFAKKEGGFLSTVDYAICVDVNPDNSRVIYVNNAYRMSRNAINYKEGVEYVDASEFNLQEYLETILKHNAEQENLRI